MASIQFDLKGVRFEVFRSIAFSNLIAVRVIKNNTLKGDTFDYFKGWNAALNFLTEKVEKIM